MTPDERFDAKYTRGDGCWNWTASISPQGYARFKALGALYTGHRYAWERANGPVPPGLELDHLCRNRRCVRPDHLEPVTHAENMRRAAKAFCKRGHPRTPENVNSTNGCRLCFKEVYNANRGDA